MLHEINEVAPHLYLCSGIAITEKNLQRLGISLVINATKELPLCNFGEDVRVVRVPVTDNCKENLYRYFEVRSRSLAYSSRTGVG